MSINNNSNHNYYTPWLHTTRFTTLLAQTLHEARATYRPYLVGTLAPWACARVVTGASALHSSPLR